MKQVRISPMKSRISALAILLMVQLFTVSIMGDVAETTRTVSQAGRQLLAKGEGAVQDAVFAHIARRLSLADFTAALYGPNRLHRRVALDAVAYVDEPWEYLPWLVSFMSAAERQTASAAAKSMVTALERASNISGTPAFPVSGQAAQLTKSLFEVANDQSLSLDLRVQAIRFISQVMHATGVEMGNVAELLQLPDEEIQLATLAVLPLPLAPVHLKSVGQVATGDASTEVRATAVALLCENAISHKVAKPSSDLKALVSELIRPGETSDAVAPILACMAHFPYRTRADVSDSIKNCGNEKVIKYWKSLSR
jgi:hypothetical protein